MQALLLAILLSFICAGCEPPPKSHETTLRDQMQQLKRGMHEDKVAHLLGRPDREEKQEEYLIWFYATKRSSDQNYTPLIFKNGYLMDWGYFNYNLIQEELRKIKSPKPVVPEKGSGLILPSEKADTSSDKQSESDQKTLWE